MLTARFIHLLGPHLQNPSPFVIDGLWAESIPARIGRSRVFDLAVEFAIDSFNFYRHATFSTRKIAMVSKGKALKALRLELQKMLSFDVLSAIKMHLHSEVCTALIIRFLVLTVTGLSGLHKPDWLSTPHERIIQNTKIWKCCPE